MLWMLTRTIFVPIKESMRVTFYVTDDRSQALKWKPHGDWCCQRECKYYKMDIFGDVYSDSDAREAPIVYEGYSDYSD